MAPPHMRSAWEIERHHEWRRGTHQCFPARRWSNDVNENAGLSGRGKKLGTDRSVHAAQKAVVGVCCEFVVALGQSGQSPIFRRLHCFRGCGRRKTKALLG
jgi:hypothetical protein